MTPHRPHRTEPSMTLEQCAAKCADMGHPGVTYNPQLDRTWCVCGVKNYLGRHRSGEHLACCGGPLDRWAS